MNKYIKKQDEVQAIQYTGDNYEEIISYFYKNTHPLCHIHIAKTRHREGEYLTINNIEDIYHAIKGDWIIRKNDGTFFVLNDKKFKEEYDKV